MVNNLVLYRKYRPQSFAEVVGQEHIVTTLTNSIKGSNIGHAYLFSGPRGSGKTTLARLFAKSINCLARTAEGEDKSSFEPCNKCGSCLEIMGSKSMDLIEIDAASHTGVDDIRQLIEGVKFAPVKSKYKIFIIDECHQLSKSAANALLKTLEEPPSHAIFLLATTESHKMIPTILSRCQKFDFKRLQVPEIIKKLEFISKKENIGFEDSALSLIALNSRGSFRDAESLLDQCISFTGENSVIKTQDIKDLLGIVEAGQIAQFIDFLIAKNTKEAITFINLLCDNGIDLQEFAKTLVFYLRQSLLLKINPDFLDLKNSGLSSQELEKIKLQTAAFSQKDLQNALEIFIDAENKIKYSAIPQLPIELAIATLTQGA
ncbi:MAG: DNA polymerase III, subunit gamma and tau [Candidatus Staskawiczbacteria bacterium RIFOXYD2_FULL_37_9]|uniref:DNA polymerase III subunit gamma/tau n=1 Tax=Candidatus Staskawiczbacteria bacterium RIFOXYB1_FULL_37_44 TaxID=1802223 RepID=A0A1G2IXA9_9BACT|nr:MAG: DNA polymerase III, subunit gamma and tau [Candidatus Staskawiczbacteria bacterium RIFOXYB1_FULL_37_44]OGZ83730.1 MAG: DNA polymerase III, subunit gamma and tau [Candidatus Staskawiczbacteria bacterium RIFOXYC1_FULL_37_52]OGZ88132.1 MAG: DNA polymerase III, subunit gamma and tau [Candidatus Staskawiczbacteria bacterium RIFOXYC2_FULL_37_19]OGZ90256.1 MAG: DNA polymerase III, subunit gamma and tau [Candidatus Staskawiczbacteria bacterium RIFOXYD1_FULL_37_110]OGZ93037.1 MAG: DNA polymerase